MSQSLYTAMGGITGAQTELNVISNNIANINTTAFKSSSANFSEVYSSTMSSGTAASGTTGGIDPMQVGLGVQVSSISKDYTSGTWVATGKSTDLMLEGDGFFTVQSSSGQKFYTRAGNFSFDSDGDFVTSTGDKVVGTSSLLATTTSTTPVHIPQKMVSEVIPNSDTSTEALTDLNNCSLTDGDFQVVANGTDPLTLHIDTAANPTMGQVATSLQTQITTAATNLAPLSTDTTSITTAIGTAYTAGAGLTAGEITAITTTANTAITDAGTALTAGYLSQAQYDTITTAANAAITTAGTLSAGTAMTSAQQTSLDANSASVSSLYNEYSGITVACNVATDGTIQFGVDGTNTTSLKFKTSATNQSNFINQTGLSTVPIAANTYTSKVLDYTVDVRQVTNIEDSTAINSYSIGNDGSIAATYANGDTLAVQLSSDGNDYEFKYTTAEGVKITGDKVSMDPNVAKVANFVVQLASVTNNQGLLSVGNNLYSAGPNCGDIIYSVGNEMGLGNVASGGLEASNVDLSSQFSAMILAQRAVQANSRVFTTTSEIMNAIVQMGQ